TASSCPTTTNWSPSVKPSCFRISSGITTWPLYESFVVAIDPISFSFSKNLLVRLCPRDRILQEVFLRTTLPLVPLQDNDPCRQSRSADGGEGPSHSFKDV